MHADGIPTDRGHRITLDEANWSVSVGNLFLSGEGGSHGSLFKT